MSGILLGFPNQVDFNAKFLHSVDHLSYYVCSAPFGHNNIKVWKEHPPYWMLCEWYSARIPQSGGFQCKISAQCWSPVLLCLLSCFGTQQYKGASPSLNILWVVLLGIPNQVHFNTKLLHSVDHLSYYVCSAALGHNNIKVWKEHSSHWVLCEWHSARIPHSGAFQYKASAQCWPPVLLCVLSCLGTRQYKGVKGASLSLNALWVVFC